MHPKGTSSCFALGRHTSDIGHWFAMTRKTKLLYKPEFVKIFPKKLHKSRGEVGIKIEETGTFEEQMNTVLLCLYMVI